MQKALFESIYNCKTEADIDSLISGDTYLANAESWFPIGQNESNFSIIMLRPNLQQLFLKN